MIEATDWDIHFVPSDSTPLLEEQKDLTEKQNIEEQHAHHPCTIPVSTNHPLVVQPSATKEQALREKI